MEQQSTKSSLTLENRARLSVTGVKRVKSTEPTSVVAELDNCLIVVGGVNLAVQNLSIAEGLLELTGVVSSINYTGAQRRRFSFRGMFR